MKEYLAFMKQYLPDGNPSETYYVFGYATAQTFVHVLAKCGNDPTRENLMKQATNIKDLQFPIMLPRIMFNTSATRYTPMSQEQLMQFNATRWVPVGDVIDAEK
jgi:branched-chain amino acid transport system substrate-binding protein